ncbi:MAG: hypothetical protein ACI9TH_001463 [Kiritimatiellia bacterium]
MKKWSFPMVAIVLVLVHEFSRHLLADSNVITSLFAAGGGSIVTVLLALGFVVLRLIVILMLPGFIAWRIGYACFARKSRTPDSLTIQS